MAAPNVHTVANSGFGKGTNELYDRARPSYRSDALSHIKQAVAKSSAPSLKVVEIGSGTGIFTRAILAHPDWQTSIAEWLAVEPSEGMREVFSKSVNDARVHLSEGTFDHTGIQDGWADLIMIAQAFHWCPDYNAAMAEFARILKPDGVAVLIWNMEDHGSAPWTAALCDLCEEHEEGTPQFRLFHWRQTFDTPSYQKYFQVPEEAVWTYHLLGSLDIVTDRICSLSYIAVLSEDEKVEVRRKVKAIVDKGEGKVWIDENDGLFQYPYKTFVEVLKRK